MRASVYLRLRRPTNEASDIELLCRALVDHKRWSLDESLVFREYVETTEANRPEAVRLQEAIEEDAFDVLVLAHSHHYSDPPKVRISLLIPERDDHAVRLSSLVQDVEIEMFAPSHEPRPLGVLLEEFLARWID